MATTNTSTSQPLILYDFDRADHSGSWAYNVWKLRLCLNYKRIPYQTSWLNHATKDDILKSLGVTPGITNPNFEYTVPTVQFPDGSVVTDSAVIAERLEEMQPEPSLGLDKELQAAVNDAVFASALPLFPIYQPQLGRIVVPESVEAYEASRKRVFGMSMEEFERTQGGEQAWKAAEPGLNAVKDVLKKYKKDEGPFVLGSRVCFADFMIVAEFETLKRVGGGMFERVMAWDESFVKLHEAASEWCKNDI